MNFSFIAYLLDFIPIPRIIWWIMVGYIIVEGILKIFEGNEYD